MSENLLTKIFDYFTNSKKSIGSRLGNFTLAIMLLVTIDFCFNISYGINQSSKLERLSNVIDLKKEYSSDSKTYKHLCTLEEKIINSKHPYDYILDFYSSFSSGDNKVNNNTNAQNAPHKIISITFTALSSSCFLIFLAFGALSAPIWSGNYSLSNIRESFFVSIVIFSIAAILTILMSNIPVIYYPEINYTLYFIVQVLFLFLAFKLYDYIHSSKNKSSVK